MLDMNTFILHHWGIDLQTEQIYTSAWGVGDKYILKGVKSIKHIKQNIHLMQQLSKCGIPTPDLVKTKEMESFVTFNDTYYFLMNRLAGKHIADVYTEDIPTLSYETGLIIAKLHKAFIQCEHEIETIDSDFLYDMKGWISDTIRESAYELISQKQLNETIDALTQVYSNLPRHLIHRDFHYGNLLFHEGELSGYIDFDLSQINARVFDLCYLLAGLLQNVGNDKKKINQWIQFKKGLIRGYEHISPLSTLEHDALYPMMKSIEMLFVAYFYRTGNLEASQSAVVIFNLLESVRLSEMGL